MAKEQQPQTDAEKIVEQLAERRSGATPTTQEEINWLLAQLEVEEQKKQEGKK